MATQKSVYRELADKYGAHVANHFRLAYTHGPRITIAQAREIAIKYARERCAECGENVARFGAHHPHCVTRPAMGGHKAPLSRARSGR